MSPLMKDGHILATRMAELGLMRFMFDCVGIVRHACRTLLDRFEPNDSNSVPDTSPAAISSTIAALDVFINGEGAIIKWGN
ncbi:hypothetical protein FRC12_000882 [Ceratobasidium sp. 428]|nr:hypothetical protein FRC12_000882 [Ceratobasidium sp. 428]